MTQIPFGGLPMFLAPGGRGKKKPSASTYPDETNTGVPTGTTLTVNNGNLFTSSNGQVIDAIDVVQGAIVIQHNNVTIRRCRVTADSFVGILNDNQTATGIVIEDCTVIVGPLPQKAAGMALKNATVRRCDISGWEGGIQVNGNMDIRDNYIHDPIPYDVPLDPHIDGIILTPGASDIVITHNTVQSELDSTSAMITVQNAAEPPHVNVSVTDNRFRFGGYTFYPPGRAATNFVFNNNTFQQGSTGYHAGNIANLTEFVGNTDELTGAPVT